MNKSLSIATQAKARVAIESDLFIKILLQG